MWAVPVLLAPFFLLAWLNPFTSEETIGNDYTVFSAPEQQELFFSLEHGSFPLYMPGFSGGQSTAAMTLGQLYHPISYVAVGLPGYWEGRAQDWNTLLRLVSLGGCHLILFLLLRKLLAAQFAGSAAVRDLVAVTLSAITVYNLRMLDAFRFGAALEAYTGHVIACVSVFTCALRPGWLPRVGVVAGVYWTVTAGHPQTAYYGLLTTAIVAVMAPFLTRDLTGGEPLRWREALPFHARMLGLGALGLVSSAAYALPFWADFLSTNVLRVGQDYSWADPFRDSIAGTIDNFFRPLRSSTQDAFGGSALVLPAALVPLLALFRVRVPGVVWSAWGLALLVMLHANGERTPVHYLVWKYLPFASSMRVAGRVTLLMPFLLLVILLWLARARPARILGREVPALTLAAVLALVATLVHASLPGADSWRMFPNAPAVLHELAPDYLARVRWIGALALVGLGGLGLTSRRAPRGALLCALVLCTSTAFQLRTCLRYGTFSIQKKPSVTLARMQKDKRQELVFQANPGHGLSSGTVLRQLEETCLEPFLGRLFPRTVPVANTDEAYRLMRLGRHPAVAIVEGELALDGPELDADASRVELVHGSYNRFVFDVTSSAPAFFGFGEPWSANWSARVGPGGDEGALEPAEVVRANGAYQGVPVPAGRSLVEFRYSSRAASLGMLLTLSTSVLVGAWVVSRMRRAWITVAGTLILGGLAWALFAAWSGSLHAGEHLGTRFLWQPTPREYDNLAYGCRTEMSPLVQPYFADRFGSGHAVDGIAEPGTGSETKRSRMPFWMVDLGSVKPIKEILVHEKWNNQLPIDVEASTDGETWESLGAFTRTPRLRLEGRPEVRFVRLRSRAPSTVLALAEVEISDRPIPAKPNRPRPRSVDPDRGRFRRER